MADFDEDEGFFEEDEDAENVHAAFERGEIGLTAPPKPFHIVTETCNRSSAAAAVIVPIPIPLGAPLAELVPPTWEDRNSGTLSGAG